MHSPLHPRSRFVVAAALAMSVVGVVPALTAAQDEVQTGGTLVVAGDSEPANLNPAIVASNGVFYVSSKVIEPLAEMDYETGLRPLLATDWSGSEDGLTFTVHTREGVNWSDGEPFTSADVAFSAMEVWKPQGIKILGNYPRTNLFVPQGGLELPKPFCFFSATFLSLHF